MEPKENSDLLAVYKNDATHATITRSDINGKVKNHEVSNGPPDGGIRAYSVVIGSFLTNGLLFGVINSAGVLFEKLSDEPQVQGVSKRTQAALASSLAMGITFLLSPVSGVLTGVLGIRLTAVIGGSLATLGLFLSSFVTEQVDALCFTYGVLYGLGASLAYTPSLAILGHYFKRHLGIVNGVVTVGSSVFTVIMPPLMTYTANTYGLDWMFRVLSVFTVGIALCGLLFKPIPLVDLEKPLREDNSVKSFIRTIFNFEIWRNKQYRVWALSIPVALFGYFVPYVHLGKFVTSTFPGSDSNLPVQCIAVTSGAGRLLFGYLADRPNVDRILLQQISFYVIGVLTIILPFMPSFSLLVCVSLGMGIFDGAFISLIGPIAIEVCGGACAAQAIGCMLGLAAVPLSLGPALAVQLRNVAGSYTLPFVLSGISPIVGATLMFTVRACRRAPVRAHGNGCSVPKLADYPDIERHPDCMAEESNQMSALKQRM